MPIPEAQFDGREISLLWALPFVGLLLSIALLPLLCQRFWEHHFAKIASAWVLAFILPAALEFGATAAAAELWRTLALDFFPFIVLLFALFVVAGGIRVAGNLVGTPATNAGAARLRHLERKPARHHRRLNVADQAPDSGQ